MINTLHRCTSTRTSETYDQIPCDGRFLADGTFTGGCDDPCRFIMKKQGEGDPPFKSAEVQEVWNEAQRLLDAYEYYEFYRLPTG